MMKTKANSRQKRRTPCPYCGEKLSARALYNHIRYRSCLRKRSDHKLTTPKRQDTSTMLYNTSSSSEDEGSQCFKNISNGTYYFI